MYYVNPCSQPRYFYWQILCPNTKLVLCFSAKISVDCSILVFLLAVSRHHIVFNLNFRFIAGVFMGFDA